MGALFLLIYFFYASPYLKKKMLHGEEGLFERSKQFLWSSYSKA